MFLFLDTLPFESLRSGTTDGKMTVVAVGTLFCDHMVACGVLVCETLTEVMPKKVAGTNFSPVSGEPKKQVESSSHHGAEKLWEPLWRCLFKWK